MLYHAGELLRSSCSCNITNQSELTVSISMIIGLASVLDYPSMLDLRSFGFATVNTSKRRGYFFGYSPGVALVTLKEFWDRGLKMVRVAVMARGS